MSHKIMKRGDVVCMLPHNPLMSTYGTPYGYVVDCQDPTEVTIRLCNSQRTECKSLRSLVVVIDKSQCPIDFAKYIPTKKVEFDEQSRLDKLELSLARIEARERVDRVDSIVAIREKLDRIETIVDKIETMVDVIGCSMGLNRR